MNAQSQLYIKKISSILSGFFAYNHPIHSSRNQSLNDLLIVSLRKIMCFTKQRRRKKGIKTKNKFISNFNDFKVSLHSNCHRWDWRVWILNYKITHIIRFFFQRIFMSFSLRFYCLFLSQFLCLSHTTKNYL